MLRDRRICAWQQQVPAGNGIGTGNGVDAGSGADAGNGIGAGDGADAGNGVGAGDGAGSKLYRSPDGDVLRRAILAGRVVDDHTRFDVVAEDVEADPRSAVLD